MAVVVGRVGFAGLWAGGVGRQVAEAWLLGPGGVEGVGVGTPASGGATGLG